MSFSSLLKSAHIVQRQAVRDYAFKSDLKIKWVRPEKIPSIHPKKSGDLAKLPAINPDELLPGFNKSKELQSADSAVQSLFLLGNNRNIDQSRHHREQMVKEVQRHALDYGSMEAKLAKMTATIRRNQEHMEKFPRDRNIKVALKELIEKRKKYLKFLRRWDYPRFEWILEKLDLVYKPPPTFFHWVTRKESLQKLTDLYCENIKEERLLAYRRELEAKQIAYLEDAVVKLAFVRQEQIECEVPVTVTEEQIAETKRELEELKAQVADAAAAAAAQRNGSENLES